MPSELVKTFVGELTGIVFALGIEAGALLDRMTQTQTTRGNGFKYHQGVLGGNNYVLVESGVGCEKALQATDNLFSIFRPARILSAGFAGALDPQLARHEIFWPKRIISADDAIDLLDGKHPKTLLTVDHVVDTCQEKRRVRESTGADLVDMESYAVARYCREKDIPFQSVRIVFDLADEELPKEIRRLASPRQSFARQFGTLAGAVFRRPSSVLDLYRLKERALVAADLLALEIERAEGRG
ncbi:MAG: hypothetical protein FWC43_03940 [Planctomycetaceae bacterium]|nr:hypothetical protein [Planctomycetaceae bacterium]